MYESYILVCSEKKFKVTHSFQRLLMFLHICGRLLRVLVASMDVTRRGTCHIFSSIDVCYTDCIALFAYTYKFNKQLVVRHSVDCSRMPILIEWSSICILIAVLMLIKNCKAYATRLQTRMGYVYSVEFCIFGESNAKRYLRCRSCCSIITCRKRESRVEVESWYALYD